MPFIAALNRFDGGVEHSLEDVRGALQLAPGIPVVDCDARDWQSVKSTLLSLFDYIVAKLQAEAAA